MQTLDWNLEYQRLAGRLLQVCRRYIKDKWAAEDIVQETFMLAMQKSAGFSGKGAWDAWMYRLTVNMALQYLRKQSQQQKKGANVSFEQLSLSEHFSLANGEKSEKEESEETNFSFSKRLVVARADFSQEQILEVIHKLPDHHKVVFNMYVMDNFSHKEIAKTLEISEGTSKSHLARARKKIQNDLYEIAMSMEKKKKSKNPLWIFGLFFLGNQGRADAACKKAFSSPMPPPAMKPELQQAINSGYGYTNVGYSALSILKMSAIGIGLVGAGSAGTYFYMDTKQPRQTIEMNEAQLPEFHTNSLVKEIYAIEEAEKEGAEKLKTEIKQDQGNKAGTKTEAKINSTEEIKTKQANFPSSSTVSVSKKDEIQENKPKKESVVLRKVVYDTVFLQEE